MGFSSPEVALWFSAFLLECILCFLVFWRRLYLRLRIFPAYLVMLALREVFLYWVYHTFGISSRLAFYGYWLSQSMVLVLRAGSIAEIIWKASRSYPGFRVIAGWLIAVLGTILLGRAWWVVASNSATVPSVILGVEHQIELTAAVVLFVLFLLWVRYDVPLGKPEKLVALGLFTYSLVQEVNNAVSEHWLRPYFHWGDRVRVASFIVVLIIWIAAVSKPLPAPVVERAPAPASDIREYMHYGTALLETLYKNLRKFRKTWGK